MSAIWGIKGLDDVEHSTTVVCCPSKVVPMLECLQFQLLGLTVGTERGIRAGKADGTHTKPGASVSNNTVMILSAHLMNDAMLSDNSKRS